MFVSLPGFSLSEYNTQSSFVEQPGIFPDNADTTNVFDSSSNSLPFIPKWPACR